MLVKWRASLAAKRRFQTCLASLVDQTKLCEASKDRTTLADSVAFLFTRIEPERSKIALTHAQFSRSATLPTVPRTPYPSIYGPTSRT